MQQVRIANDKVKAKRNREKWFCIIFTKLVFFGRQVAFLCWFLLSPKHCGGNNLKYRACFKGCRYVKAVSTRMRLMDGPLPLFLLVCKKIKHIILTIFMLLSSELWYKTKAEGFSFWKSTLILQQCTECKCKITNFARKMRVKTFIESMGS